jgi:hypothetical protein
MFALAVPLLLSHKLSGLYMQVLNLPARGMTVFGFTTKTLRLSKPSTANF